MRRDRLFFIMNLHLIRRSSTVDFSAHFFLFFSLSIQSASDFTEISFILKSPIGTLGCPEDRLRDRSMLARSPPPPLFQNFCLCSWIVSGPRNVQASFAHLRREERKRDAGGGGRRMTRRTGSSSFAAILLRTVKRLSNFYPKLDKMMTFYCENLFNSLIFVLFVVLYTLRRYITLAYKEQIRVILSNFFYK